MDVVSKNKAAMASFLVAFLAALPASAQVDINVPDVVAKWHDEPPPVLQHPCVVIDKVNNMTYMIGYDSQGSLVFNFVQQSMCSSNWSSVIWTSLPYPGGGKPYHTEQCFLTANNHFGVQYEGGIAVWDHWARTWTYKAIPCELTYPNNAALVYQNKDAHLDDILIQWQDSKGAHLTAVQLLNDNVNSCYQLPTTNVPTDMSVAASTVTGKNFFLFGKKSSCWYDIESATSPSTQPVTTTSECHPLPALNIGTPRAVNVNGTIYVFGKNDVGVGVWSVDARGTGPYTIVPRSQGAPIDGDFSVADCGTGIIVYGGCSSPDKCSTNLKPGESLPPGTITPPTVIYIPPGDNNGGGGNGGGGGGGNGGGGGGNGGGGGGGGNGGGGGGGGGGDGSGGGGGNGGGGNGGGGNGGGGNGGGGNGGGGNGGGGGGNGGGGGGNGGGGGSWQPPVPPTVPTGIPSGGPTVVPPTATIPATATSGNLVPTGPPGLPDGGSKTSGGGSNNTGAIIGGIVGGIALICLIALLFVFARRRRRREEENLAGGGAGGDHSQYEAHHGGIPPLVPIAPIGDLDEVVVEDKDIPGAPDNENNFPGGPSGGGVVPGGPTDGGHYPGGPTDGNNFPGGPTDGGYYPGGPTDGNNIPGGPSGNGGVVPPVGGGSHSHLPGIIGGVVGGAIIGGAIASHKKKDEKETVTHGHVTPVPVPGGPSTSTETTENRHGGSVYPVPVPGGPNSDNSNNQPSGSGGVFPVGGSSSSSSTETSHHYGKDILIGGAAAGAVIGGAIIAGKRNNSSDSLSKTTRTTVKTTVTTTKNGGRIFTTTGSGGRTVVTERTETGAARHIITGVIPGQTTVRTITQRTETGEEILVPVDEPEGDCREVVTERSENGQIRYIIGGIIAGAVAGGIVRKIHSSSSSSSVDGGSTTISSSTRIITERSSTGEVRYIIVGGFSGNAVRVITERTSTGETRLIPTNEPTGELRHVIAERSESGEIRYIIGGIIAGGIVKTVTESSSSGSTRVIPGGSSVVSSSTRIITERTSTGEIRYIIVGGFSGNAIRVITERTSTGETRLIPTNEESGELRHVISERSESGEIRYIIGGVITSNTVTRVIMGPRIVTERTSSGEIRYVIIDQYNGNAIRTKFERNEETGEFVHTPVKEPEGELRYVTEERTESGEIRKVIGTVITGNVTTTTRTVSGGVVPEGISSSSQTRIVSEQTESGEIRYYQITIVDGKEVRTLVERTEDGGFRIPGGAIIVGAGAALIGNNHHTTTTTRVVGGGTLTPAEQAANKTQITLKLSIMRYERADASAAIPSAAVGTVMFSKFKMIAAGDVNIDDTAYSHVEETKAPMSRRTLKWMKTEAHWKREAGMLQHLKSDRYIADLYTLYSLPTFAEYRYVSVLGSFSRTLESYMLTQKLNSLQIRQLTLALSDALRWCHEHHVVHLNVRPSSFYLDGVPGADGTNASGQLIWKLWNFGHARFVGESVDTAVTTVTYAAPEILNGRKSKTDSNVLSAVSMDRWSLGLILYELHVGKPYFVNAADAELQLTTDEGARFQVALDGVKEQDAKVAIRGLLEVDVEKRYTHETLREVYFGKI